MNGSRFTVGIALVAAILAAWPARATAAPERPASAARTQEWGLRTLDVNRLALRVSNVGSFPYVPEAIPSGDAATTPAVRVGLAYPRGARAGVILFAAGLWLGGRRGADTCVSVAEYASDFLPGSLSHPMPNGDPRMTVYKVAPWKGNPADTAHVVRDAAAFAADPAADPLVHHSWGEYMAGAARYGAPWRVWRLPATATPSPDDSVDVPGPDVLGDQMLWCLYRDGENYEPRGNYRTGSFPLSVEVRQTTFGFDRPGPLGGTAFVRYEIVKRQDGSIPDLRVGLWADPDIGSDFHDDLTGSDSSRSLGFAYNTPWGRDPFFGAAKPAFAFRILSARSTAGTPAGEPMRAFVEYVNGTDPIRKEEYWNLLRGLRVDGSVMADPAAGTPLAFQYPGDPLVRTGWLDPQPSNVKSLAASGPLALAIGDTVVVWAALTVAQGPTPLGSLGALRCAVDDLADVYSRSFAEPFAAPRVCELPAEPCPRGSDWWAARCAGAPAFTPGQWEAIASWADSASVNIAPVPPPQAPAFCAPLGATASLRDSLRRELQALLANAAVAALAIRPAGGDPIGLPLTTGALVPPLIGGTVADLLGRDEPRRGPVDAVYENDDAANRRALAGVGGPLPYFGGGAGAAALGTGSALDPAATPDSFPTVLLRFDPAHGQRAYRYLRLETADGSAPGEGRAYRYAGHRFVPLTAWDLHLGIQLELAFAERAATRPDGTLLGADSQPASYDSTWAPTSDADGGQERLWVIARPYASTPRPAYSRDGVPLEGAWPALYQLDVRRRSAADVLDLDGFRFVAGWPATGSADALVRALATAAPGDSEAVSLQRGALASLRELNLGLGLGATCGRAKPLRATLVEATVSGSEAVLRWRLDESATNARVEYRTADGVWMDGAPAVLGPDGDARARLTLPATSRTARRAVRLVAACDAFGLARSDSAWLEVAWPERFALLGLWPNPSSGSPRVAFSLPAAAAARVDLFDLAGRRVHQRDLGTLPAGQHVIELAPGVRLRPGIYFVVFRAGGAHRTSRFVAL